MTEEELGASDVYSIIDGLGVKRDDPRVPVLLDKLRKGGYIKSTPGMGDLKLAGRPADKPYKDVPPKGMMGVLGQDKKIIPGIHVPIAQANLSPGSEKHDSTMSSVPPVNPRDPNKGFGSGGGLSADKISDPEAFAMMGMMGAIPNLFGLAGSAAGSFAGMPGSVLGGATTGYAGAQLQNQMMTRDGAFSTQDMNQLNERIERFRKEHPQLAWTAELLPNLLTGKPWSSSVTEAIKSGSKDAIKKAVKQDLGARALGAGAMGGVGTAQRKLSGGEVDAGTVLADLAAGFVSHGDQYGIGKVLEPRQAIPSLREGQTPAPDGGFPSPRTTLGGPNRREIRQVFSSLGLADSHFSAEKKARAVEALNRMTGLGLDVEGWKRLGPVWLGTGDVLPGFRPGTPFDYSDVSGRRQGPRANIFGSLPMDENGNTPLFDPDSPGMGDTPPLNVFRDMNMFSADGAMPQSVDPTLPPDPATTARRDAVVRQNQELVVRQNQELVVRQNQELVVRLQAQLATAKTASAERRIKAQLDAAIEQGRTLEQDPQSEVLPGRPSEESLVANLISRRRQKEEELANQQTNLQTSENLAPVALPTRYSVPDFPVPTATPDQQTQASRAELSKDLGKSPIPTADPYNLAPGQETAPPHDPIQSKIDSVTAKSKALEQSYNLYKDLFDDYNSAYKEKLRLGEFLASGKGSPQDRATAATNIDALNRLISELPKPESKPAPTPRSPSVEKSQTSENQTTETTEKPAPKPTPVAPDDLSPSAAPKPVATTDTPTDTAPGQVGQARPLQDPAPTTTEPGTAAPGRLATAEKEKATAPGQVEKPKTKAEQQAEADARLASGLDESLRERKEAEVMARLREIEVETPQEAAGRTARELVTSKDEADRHRKVVSHIEAIDSINEGKGLGHEERLAAIRELLDDDVRLAENQAVRDHGSPKIYNDDLADGLTDDDIASILDKNNSKKKVADPKFYDIDEKAKKTGYSPGARRNLLEQAAGGSKEDGGSLSSEQIDSILKYSDENTKVDAPPKNATPKEGDPVDDISELEIGDRVSDDEGNIWEYTHRAKKDGSGVFTEVLEPDAAPGKTPKTVLADPSEDPFYHTKDKKTSKEPAQGPVDSQTSENAQDQNTGAAKAGGVVKFPVGKTKDGETVYKQGTVVRNTTDNHIVEIESTGDGLPVRVDVDKDKAEIVSRGGAKKTTTEDVDISSPSRGDEGHYIETGEDGTHYLHRTKTDKATIPERIVKSIKSILSRFPVKTPADKHDLSVSMARSFGSSALDPSVDNSGKIIKVYNGDTMTLAVIRRRAAGRPSGDARSINLHQPDWLDSVWKSTYGKDSALPPSPGWVPGDEVSPYGASRPTIERALQRTRDRLNAGKQEQDPGKPEVVARGVDNFADPVMKMFTRGDFLEIPVVNTKHIDRYARAYPGSEIELKVWKSTSRTNKIPSLNTSSIVKGQITNIIKNADGSGTATVRVSENTSLSKGQVVLKGTEVDVYMGGTPPDGFTGLTIDNISRLQTKDSAGKRDMITIDENPIGGKINRTLAKPDPDGYYTAKTIESQTSASKSIIAKSKEQLRKAREKGCP